MQITEVVAQTAKDVAEAVQVDCLDLRHAAKISHDHRRDAVRSFQRSEAGQVTDHMGGSRRELIFDANSRLVSKATAEKPHTL